MILMNVIVPTPVDLELYAQMSLEEKNAPVHQDMKEILTPLDATMPTNAHGHHLSAEETLFALTPKEDFGVPALLDSSGTLQSSVQVLSKFQTLQVYCTYMYYT